MVDVRETGMPSDEIRRRLLERRRRRRGPWRGLRTRPAKARCASPSASGGETLARGLDAAARRARRAYDRATGAARVDAHGRRHPRHWTSPDCAARSRLKSPARCASTRSRAPSIPPTRSVYQIEPLGVVVPRTRDDLVRLVGICAAFRCPITMRGGGTSQAGQAIGPGLIVDTSKYLNRDPRGQRRGTLGARRARHRARRAERRSCGRTGCASRPTSRPPAAPPSAA